MSKPSDTLRAAAARIREVAQAATPGPWSHEHEGGHIVHGPDGTIAEAEYGPDGAHVALWHPVVAEAVAVWLVSASRVERAPGQNPALAVARLILGEAKA